MITVTLSQDVKFTAIASDPRVSDGVLINTSPRWLDDNETLPPDDGKPRAFREVRLHAGAKISIATEDAIWLAERLPGLLIAVADDDDKPISRAGGFFPAMRLH